MEVKEELRTVAHSIIDAYELRVETVSGCMAQANEMLRKSQVELERMIDRLRDNLAKRECLRRKDFDRMMKDIVDHQNRTQEDVVQALQQFQREEREMVSRLRDILTNDRDSGLKDIQTIKEDILTRQKRRERGVAEKLRRFQIEQETLGIELKRLLSKGESVKIRDFRLMLKGIRAQQSQTQREVERMLAEFAMVREQISDQWNRVARTTLPKHVSPSS